MTEQKRIAENAPDLVSVILPTFNRAGLMEQSLESIFNQTYPRIEIIVIDDGSTDTTEAIVSKYLDKLTYKKIANSGKAVALNAGLKMARGDFIFILDDDDLALPNAIEHHVRALHANPNAGLSYSSYYRGHSDKHNQIDKTDLVIVPDVGAENVFAKLLTAMFFTQQGSMVRMKCYRDIGGFNPAMKRAQDYEMMLRLTRQFPAAYVVEPTVVIRTHEGMRGPMSERFSARERMMRGWKYATLLYSQMYVTLPLQDYLPRFVAVAGWTPALQREALIKRMSDMMRKGVWEGSLADLFEVVENQIDIGPLSPNECTACEAAMRHPPTLLDLANNRNARRQLSSILSRRAARVIDRHFIRGAYWGSRELFDKGEIVAAVHICATTIILSCTIWLSRLVQPPPSNFRTKTRRPTIDGRGF